MQRGVLSHPPVAQPSAFPSPAAGCGTLSPAIPFPNSLPTEVMGGKKMMVVILSHEGLM